MKTHRANPSLTVGHIAHLTGNTDHDTNRLIRAGFFDDMTRDELFTLCSTNLFTDIVEVSNALAIIRLGIAGKDSDGRPTGYSCQYTDQQIKQASCMYWTVSPDNLLAANIDAAVVTYAGVVVAAYIFKGEGTKKAEPYHTPKGRLTQRWSYDFEQLATLNTPLEELSEEWSPAQREAAMMVGYRFKTGGGQPVMKFNPAPQK